MLGEDGGRCCVSKRGESAWCLLRAMEPESARGKVLWKKMSSGVSRMDLYCVQGTESLAPFRAPFCSPLFPPFSPASSPLLSPASPVMFPDLASPPPAPSPPSLSLSLPLPLLPLPPVSSFPLDAFLLALRRRGVGLDCRTLSLTLHRVLLSLCPTSPPPVLSPASPPPVLPPASPPPVLCPTSPLPVYSLDLCPSPVLSPASPPPVLSPAFPPPAPSRASLPPAYSPELSTSTSMSLAPSSLSRVLPS